MRRSRPLWREYLDALMVAVLLALFTKAFLFQAFKIPSESMADNLLVGDHLLVNKFIYASTASPLERRWLPKRALRRGDVAVFKFPRDPGRDFIKRCVGLPGDRVEVVDKQLLINGEAIDERGVVQYRDDQILPRSRYLTEEFRTRDQFGPYTVPDGNYFCLGDNRDRSSDSRHWGPVPASHLKGRAVVIYWSVRPRRVTAASLEDEEAGIAGQLERAADGVGRLFTATRWRRFLRLVR